MSEETQPTPTEETTAPAKEAPAVDIDSMLSEAAKRATGVTTKKIYTQIDAMLEGLGVERGEDEKTMDALKRFIEKASTPATTESKEDDDSAKVYEAQLDEQRKQNAALLAEIEAQKAAIQKNQRLAEVTASLEGKLLAIPENLPDDAANQYAASIKAMIRNGIAGLEKKTVNGESYYFENGKPLISASTGEAMTTAELVAERYSHFFAKPKTPTVEQLAVMSKEGKSEAAKVAKVTSYDEAKNKAAETYTRNSPDWAKAVHELCKANGIKI